MTESEQQAWIQAAQEGDEYGFTQIFYHYQTRLFHMARRMVGDPAEAEDVVQQSFIKAFNNIAKVREPAQFKSWLYRIVYTTSVDSLRRRKRRDEIPLDEQIYVRRAPTTADPLHEALRQEKYDLIEEALQQMSPINRAYIILREFLNLSYKEMAQALDKTLPAVRIGLFRAREQLREYLPQTVEEDAA
ncbi:MAG: sigma-70 family RNA polymerase sigma factor [Chloroflexia bacterium]|nr:sigma-70 family RNA polymerase sigma factor [Chloroflexia bacterium]